MFEAIFQWGYSRETGSLITDSVFFVIPDLIHAEPGQS